jgi:hypothetical protein
MRAFPRRAPPTTPSKKALQSTPRSTLKSLLHSRKGGSCRVRVPECPEAPKSVEEFSEKQNERYLHRGHWAKTLNVLRVMKSPHPKPGYKGISRTLGLTSLHGPVSYTFLTPAAHLKERLPTIVLLGEVHTPASCPETCSRATCKSADGKTVNTFMTYMNRKYPGTDMFFETWTDRHLRKQKPLVPEKLLPNTDTMYFETPMTRTIHACRYCFLPQHAHKCPYPNLRMHSMDTRRINDSFTLGDFSVHHKRELNRKMVFGDIVRLSRGDLERVWGHFYPGFTALEIFDAFTMYEKKGKPFFDNPVLAAHSRVTHELNQLSDTVRKALRRRATTTPFYAPDPILPEVRIRIRQWLKYGVASSCLSKADACVILQHYKKHIDMHEMDLYGLARALKVNSEGKRSHLCVFYMGDVHCDTMLYLLQDLYTVQVRVRSETKCLKLGRRPHPIRATQELNRGYTILD